MSNVITNHIRRVLIPLLTLLLFAIVFAIAAKHASAETMVEINSTNFPDQNFRHYLLDNFNTYKDPKTGKNYLTESIIKDIKVLQLNAVGNVYYTDLKGINFLTSLEELYCEANTELTSLDISKNTALKVLHCDGTGLTYLNISNNKDLEELWCQNCHLSSLVTTNNTKLEYINCRNNQITALDLKTNTELETLLCYQNKLAKLDLSKNTKLKTLNCSYNEIENLDLSKNSFLESASCQNNLLETLNISTCNKLTDLFCFNNLLTTIEFKDNYALINIECNNNKLTGTLNLRNCTKLETLYCQKNTLETLVLNKESNIYKNYQTASKSEDAINKTIDYRSNGTIILSTDSTVQIYGMASDNKQETVDEAKIRAFVTRFYIKILDRIPQESEVTDWTNRLIAKTHKGSDIAHGFVMSKEFTARNFSDEDFVEIMYEAFFDRASDAAGKQTWVDLLKKGKTREYVLAGFVNSKEFTKLCEECGIERGTLVVKNPDVKPDKKKVRHFKIDTSGVDEAKLDAFVERLYTDVLERPSDPEGKAMWKRLIMENKDYDAVKAPRIGFFESKEYLKKNTSNEQFVIDAYRAFLGREPDADGYSFWVKQLQGGYSRRTMLDVGFGNSDEFKKILESYGFKVTIEYVDAPN